MCCGSSRRTDLHTCAAYPRPVCASIRILITLVYCVSRTAPLSRKGEIIEGAEDDIRATYYILAFQREFNDDEAELRWKVVDMMVVGGEALIGLHLQPFRSNHTLVHALLALFILLMHLYAWPRVVRVVNAAQ